VEALCRDVIRERTIGNHNQVILTGPATGPVAYSWIHQKTSSRWKRLPTIATSQPDLPPPDATCVSLLVKKGDEELMNIAADAVRNLTMVVDDDDYENNPSSANIHVLLEPELAAQLMHYHGVHGGDRIHLFEPKGPTPGFGDNLREQPRYTSRTSTSRAPQPIIQFDDDDDELVSTDTADEVWQVAPWHDTFMSSSSKDEIIQETIPDLICTLGGDGLLMHAGMMFQGPVPPILCVAGGS
jgi:hypothetical protein